MSDQDESEADREIVTPPSDDGGLFAFVGILVWTSVQMLALFMFLSGVLWVLFG